jgi:hypothetical protein
MLPKAVYHSRRSLRAVRDIVAPACPKSVLCTDCKGALRQPLELLRQRTGLLVLDNLETPWDPLAERRATEGDHCVIGGHSWRRDPGLVPWPRPRRWTGMGAHSSRRSIKVALRQAAILPHRSRKIRQRSSFTALPFGAGRHSARH